MKNFKAHVAAITLMKPQEQRSAVAAFAMVFLLMAVYFVLRPVRDSMASDWTDAEVSYLWNIQFFLSMGIVMLYGFCVARIRFNWVVPGVYAFFATTFLLFYLLTGFTSDQGWIEKVFYLWVTAFSLLNLSVFWSFMSEIFSQNQGKRLFAFIGAGASAGAMVGPAIPTLFADVLGLSNLMLVAALGLLAVIPLIMYLSKQSQQPTQMQSSNQWNHAIGGRWWSGFRDTFKNPYLLGIAIFILLYVLLSGFIYFQQKNLLAAFSRPERTQILGGIDWLVNVLTFVFAFVITGRMVKKLGMGWTLAVVPVLMVLGFVLLAWSPLIGILLALQVTRRVGNYAITRPGREMLFTQVSQSERFKAKPVIDVVVYRGGDAVSASIFALLTEGLGFGLAGMSLIGAAVAFIWMTSALYIGRKYDRHQTAPDNDLSTHTTNQYA